MFTPSTVTVSGAVYQIADAAGASADAEMRERALISLQAATKYLNGRAKWAWLYAEANPQQVIAPFTLAITASAGQASASALTGHGVATDDIFTCNGFLAGTRVSATAASGFGLTTSATATVSANASMARDFYAFPTDFRQVYTVRLLALNQALAPAQRRAYDRGYGDQTTPGVVAAYDIFSQFQRGKVRLLPPPNASDVMEVRYLRRMEMATASAQSTALDIPQDFDLYLLAWAKWHFLTDKADGRGDQATTWLNLANEGIRTMMAEQTNLMDESLGFIAHAGFARERGPYSVRWEYS